MPDWSLVATQLREQVTGGWDDAYGVARFEDKGGRFLRGRGHLTAPRTIAVGDTTVTASRGILVATGSAPFIPPIDGLSEVDYWTNHEAIAAETLPESLLVLGGGAVGCELGQVFARFGVDVTIIEGQDRVLAHEEPEVSAKIEAVFAEEGIHFARRKVEVVSAEGEPLSEDAKASVADELVAAPSSAAPTGASAI